MKTDKGTRTLNRDFNAMHRTVECQLCPKYCRIAPGRSGDCRTRVNVEGKLVATSYGFPCAIHIDPIEKKPLFHFLPGSPIFSVATAGCNLHCLGCQNDSISQVGVEEVDAFELSPDQLIQEALRVNSLSIAYTYTEPLTYYEYTFDCSSAARKAGLKNVLVTAGFINEKPLRRLARVVDAANVDLKAFNDPFYQTNCSANLKPVLNTLEVLREEGVWLEITNLVIPTLNDDMDEIRRMCGWILERLGPDVPLHFSRFHPRHRLRNLPPTPGETLEQARKVAMDAGLHFVYVGNLRTRDGENTTCPNPSCPERSRPLVERIGFEILENRITQGRCPACGTTVPGVWEKLP